MKKIILSVFLIISGSIWSLAEHKTNINLSAGQSSFIILNASRDKWSDNRLKLGIEGNYIYRNIVTIPQNVLDLKVYTGWKLVKKEEISLDLRIGYGVTGAYYPSNNRTDFGYAPLIGANLKYSLSPAWLLNAKMMCSLFSDGIGAPYQIGVNHKMWNRYFFLGLQGIYGLNIGNAITSNIETGICVGIEL
jgi:hypothetical protein